MTLIKAASPREMVMMPDYFGVGGFTDGSDNYITDTLAKIADLQREAELLRRSQEADEAARQRAQQDVDSWLSFNPWRGSEINLPDAAPSASRLESGHSEFHDPAPLIFSTSEPALNSERELRLSELRLEFASLPGLQLSSLLSQTETLDKPVLLGPSEQLTPAPWVILTEFAAAHGFTVTNGLSSSGHNEGSAHYIGYAVDVRTNDKSGSEVDALIRFLWKFDLVVRDERMHPPGQKEWHGPHLHINKPKPGRDRFRGRLLSPLFGAGARLPE